ncbi:AfsR/SARP family transcriptional regulator [Flavimaricola marinus]|uniref:Bacterial transcriptional activator domain protein n=1 Tax=Flavimaricola marinus TaxID=1819565 RepID=A0A238LA33_9RHOB|nr:BTAD domain-containing putative transcriptional regulator [Flavimaricola marinus]SMY06275.1 Bacterial transcriptional activator domain protein [Flavimaricola marinus]
MLVATATPTLCVSLFGPLRLRHQTGHHPLNLTGATRELLAFLLTRAGEASRREVLIETFWPDATLEKGRSALTTALWRVKKVLGRTPGLGLYTFDDLVSIETDEDVLVDVVALESAGALARREMNDAGALDPQTRRQLATAVRAVSGPFLEGCDSHWVLIERERLTGVYISKVRLLMRDAEARRAYDDGLDWGRLLLATDPLLEAVHHDMIALYARAGERRRAILQYETLWEVLHNELGIEPNPATRALRDRILAGEPATAAMIDVAAGRSDAALAEL